MPVSASVLAMESQTAMFDACRKANVALAVGHSRRFWPTMRALRDIVASGKLGTILHVEGHNSNENSNSVVAGSRLSPEESPGGGLTDAGLHILDASVSMMGPVHRVYAQLNPREPGPTSLDTAMITLDFVNGVTGSPATVRATHSTAVSMSSEQRDPRKC
jgi:predicted dehydrogenase